MSDEAGSATRIWKVEAGQAGERLDRALAGHLGIPRSRVQSWIAAGRVSVDGSVPAKSGVTLRVGETIRWSVPPAVDDRVAPEAGELRVLLEEPGFVVLDKPPDLAVHPGAGRRSGTLAHRILAHYPETAGVGGPGRPGIVHRLDRGTSGAILVARNASAHATLARDFAARRIDKRYLGIVWGRPRQDQGQIELAIGRHPSERKKMAVRVSGRPARTDWRLIASAGAVSLLEFHLLTGRTHQIRVHARAVGHPLVGDPVYGEARHRGLPARARHALAAFPRPALHAWKLVFPHPESGEPVSVTAPPPQDLIVLWEGATGTPFPAPKDAARSRAPRGAQSAGEPSEPDA